MLTNLINRLNFYFYKVISIMFREKRVKTCCGSFKMITSTPDEVHRVLTFNKKEPETINWINAFQSDGRSAIVLFDVGANVGIYSLYTCLRHPKSKVFSFEPDSQSFASLSRNIFLNRFGAIPYPIAISNESGIGNVSLSSMSAGAGACALGEQYMFSKTDSQNISKQGIFFCTIDDLVFKFGLPCPNYIKIDVDGIEKKILCGAMQVLKSKELKGVLVEFQYKAEDDLDNDIEYLASSGLCLVSKSDWISSYGDLNSRNYIFSK